MPSLPPTQAAPQPPHEVIATNEGGGVVLTCSCLWLRWYHGPKDAEAGRREHAKKHKVVEA